MCIQINTRYRTCSHTQFQNVFRCHQARLHDDSQVPRAPQSASSIKSDSSGAREFMSLPSTPGTPGTMSTTRTDYEGLVLASPVTVPERQMFDNTRVRCVWAPTRVATRPKEGMCADDDMKKKGYLSCRALPTIVMATKKSRQRISYVIESPKASAGHKLGVNGLAVDPDNSILYSGGRDGVICAWDLNLDLKAPRSSSTVDQPNGRSTSSPTTFRSQAIAHMGWINDIVLAQNNTALVSGSSDLTVKVWRPHSQEQAIPQTIGEHADYVKVVAAPPSDIGAPWVASGGLDRRINLWDLNGGGKVLSIDCSGEENTEKGSVYALCAGRNLIANGGPESTVRLWDPKSGKRVTKFVGHTATIRSILINDAGDLVLTGSSDQTIKLWSVTAGRCMYNFTMHNESVWSLFSESPDLGVFYSSDRSGLVVKTDVRGSLDHMDDGLSLAVAKETDSVHKVIACGDHIWTATPSSSINRWASVPTGSDVQLPEVYRHHRASSTASRSAMQAAQSGQGGARAAPKEISPKSILRISNTAYFPLSFRGTKTIEGQFGLLKYKLLHDRRRVLTVDTAGEVVLWDLIQCKPIQTFGKRHLEDVEPSVNQVEAVAPWCSIDTSSGSITVTLDPFNCFDAEVYADELTLENADDFREDQRINLGKWVLRYLFAGAIDEEIKRDAVYRRNFNTAIEKRLASTRMSPPLSISLPERGIGFEQSGSMATPRASGQNYPLMTPGLQIGLATPHPGGGDTATPTPAVPDLPSSQVLKPVATTPAVPTAEATTGDAKPADADKDKAENGPKAPSTPFGKKFRMGIPFSKKARSASTTADKPAIAEDKPVDDSEGSLNLHEKEVDDSFFGVVQRIRNEYDKQLAANPDFLLDSRITPALPSETPHLGLPKGTKVIIKEETGGESSNVYVGTIETIGRDTDVIEQKGAMWLGDLLLQNQVPFKEPVKVSFVLLPYKDELPPLPSSDNNNRLNANRMLRVRKILSYIAEKIDSDWEDPESVPADAMKPEEYLELYCNDQLLPNAMSLATLRAHLWKGGTDVVLYYRSNGRKAIRLRTPVPAEPPSAQEEATTAEEEPNATTGA
ncbi:unnamed protein product [Parascedosporium putredinis]|uniref:WD40 repeat-like protein n=1 Tax=Parascedosporium putredinis TaxID=1442378 RepID=A0A9P1MGB0_9PEZI|nr:unnamed protein product [Parascedosporium putredinis]CAI8004109.1 unnamed protein product [Parascedosporium putredinis]